LDFIDLTGDDEYDPDFVAQQVKEEKRRIQEKEDRALALSLSSQESPTPANIALPPRNNALSRLMQTQQRNAEFAAPTREPEWSGPSSFSNPIQMSTIGMQPSQMPVTYDSSWDNDFNTGLGADFPYSSMSLDQMSDQHIGPLAPNLGYSSMSGYQPPSLGPFASFQPNSYTQAQVPFLPPGQVPIGMPSQPPLAPPNGFTRASHVLPQPARTLSTIINRTNHFDLTKGYDDMGQPLPERLTNYLNDVMYDSRVSEKELEELMQNIRPDMEIPDKHRDGTPNGLKSNLYLHQEVALTWLKNMEEGTNKGGILADDMGLGKTISMLALMLFRPANKRPKV
jgi:hypothetical protein